MMQQEEQTLTARVSNTDVWTEGQGQTVDDALANALDGLGGVSREGVEVEVISEGARAIPGESLSGAQAVVRIRPMDEFTARGKQLLENLLTAMDIPARVTVRRATPSAETEGEGVAEPPVLLDVAGDDLGVLIGWRGETLRALQTVLNLMVAKGGAPTGRRILIDVERYRARREEQVQALAQRLAERVKRTGERNTLDPMHANERRAIHLALQNDKGVWTESIGVEPARRVVIHPVRDPEQ